MEYRKANMARPQNAATAAMHKCTGTYAASRVRLAGLSSALDPGYGAEGKKSLRGY